MVVSLSEFEAMPEKDKKKTLRELKSEIGVSGITEAWGISRSKVYALLHDLNIPLEPRKTNKNEDTEKKKHKTREENTGEVMMDYNSPEMFNPRLGLELETTPFTLHLETSGSIGAISEAVQLLLSSGKLGNTNLHLNLTINQI